MPAIQTSPLDELTSPVAWPWAVSAPPTLSSERSPWQAALLRRWSGTSPIMVQPPLDQHYIVMHLGGAKKVSRRHDGPAISAVADCGSLTLVPAGTAYTWNTEGPIAFAHLYLRPERIDALARSESAGDGRPLSLIDPVGCRDGMLELMFVRMLDEIQTSPHPSKLLLDSLLESFCVRLTQKYVPTAPGRNASAVSLAPHRLRRVLEFIEAELGSDIALADLVEAAGTSQYHFSRAFRMATGMAPYQYLISRRVEYARVLLLASNESLASISALCGFCSKRQFAVMFKRYAGVGPKHFRLSHASPRRLLLS